MNKLIFIFILFCKTMQAQSFQFDTLTNNTVGDIIGTTWCHKDSLKLYDGTVHVKVSSFRKKSDILNKDYLVWVIKTNNEVASLFLISEINSIAFADIKEAQDVGINTNRYAINKFANSHIVKLYWHK